MIKYTQLKKKKRVGKPFLAIWVLILKNEFSCEACWSIFFSCFIDLSFAMSTLVLLITIIFPKLDFSKSFVPSRLFSPFTSMLVPWWLTSLSASFLEAWCFDANRPLFEWIQPESEIEPSSESYQLTSGTGRLRVLELKVLLVLARRVSGPLARLRINPKDALVRFSPNSLALFGVFISGVI